jgi:hypothetical protein
MVRIRESTIMLKGAAKTAMLKMAQINPTA